MPWHRTSAIRRSDWTGAFDSVGVIGGIGMGFGVAKLMGMLGLFLEIAEMFQIRPIDKWN